MSDYKVWIPFVNRVDMLWRAVASVSDVHDQVAIIDNSKEGLEGKHGDPQIIRPLCPITFSETQNCILAMTRKLGANICVFMHSDAEAGHGVIMGLISLARRYTKEGRKWGVIFTAYDALAAFNVEAFESIGGWDEQFTWYGADQDTYRRIKLAGYELIDSGLPVYHEPSQTLKADPEIRRRVDEGFTERESYYRAKWGGPAGAEIFTKPFNSDGSLK